VHYALLAMETKHYDQSPYTHESLPNRVATITATQHISFVSVRCLYARRRTLERL